MEPVTIRLCGPLELRVGERRLEAELPSRQGRMAFAYLALHRDRETSRDELIDALWPEPSNSQALLTALLSRLRHALPPGMLHGRARLSLELGEAPWVDVEAAAAAPAAAERSLARGDPATALRTASATLEILRHPLLPGVERDWLDAPRRELDEAAAALLELEGRAALALGDGLRAEAAARRLVDREPYRESGHALLIECHAARGEISKALNAYDALRTRLREELGTVPGPRLRALGERLLREEVDPHPLPRPATPLVGRDADVARVVERLKDPATRILTLLGPGGVGKTRLALEAAERVAASFRDGVRVAWLDPVAEPAYVQATLARAVGGEAGQDPAHLLSDARLLLVADNFEHVIEAAPGLAAIAEGCPGVTVLVTSRERLRLRAERLFHVEPLGADAVTLFAERAQALDADFQVTPAVAGLCAQLDGLPLAIELAAAWTSSYPVEEIARRHRELLGRADAAARDLPPRQRTLHATLEWSLNRLSAAEREAFVAFAVFNGGAPVASAEAVIGGRLEPLVAKSLVRCRGGRAAMLTTLREYAAPAIGDAIRRRHAQWCLELAREHGPGMLSFEAAPEQALERELGNLRAALVWSAMHAPRLHADLCAELRRFWWGSGRADEGLRELDRARPATPAARAALLHGRAVLSPFGSPERRRDAEAAIHAFAALGDRPGEIEATFALIEAELNDGEWERAERLGQRALVLAGDDPLWRGRALSFVTFASGAIARARETIDESVRCLSAAGATVEVAMILSSVAFLAIRDEAYDEAAELLDEALDAARAGGAGAHRIAQIRGNQGLVALFTGRHAAAERAFRDELEHGREGRFRNVLPEGLLGLAGVAAAMGEHLRSARLAGAAEACTTAAIFAVDELVLERVRKRFLVPACAAFGDARWRRAERAGASLSPREAVTEALA
ncbi:hypothetical protein OM076_43505 [Solirubrobacter ginsenosidimutans]|uniref:Bacterial transcriptional activator domain-containing protein n=1 Tax=Solirubrobacter ginsenosidimutans TaxID=490573 RepID=A0A9X3S6U0_9ACTN|nr:BTAD domain-containing putative transcriptional regulator [Solirubrobacter ginsenosidimutans]MDA0167207.1 hypothetical protein [Solirubrobacter ginsenosidimutans]